MVNTALDEDMLRAAWWAGLLAEHALLAFGVALGLLLLATTLVVSGAQRLAAHRPAAVWRAGSAARLGLSLAGGAAVVLGAAAVFSEMMEWTDADDALGAFDTALAHGLSASLPSDALRAFGLLTHAGDTAVLTAWIGVVALALLWRGQRRLALAWVAAGAGNAVLNVGLKQVFARVRPVHDHGFALADGFSFPSGHTSGAVAVYGMLACLVIRLAPMRWHLPAVLAAVALAFSIGASRVLLQVHWASDALAGFASGAAWLTVCVLASRRWNPQAEPPLS